MFKLGSYFGQTSYTIFKEAILYCPNSQLFSFEEMTCAEATCWNDSDFVEKILSYLDIKDCLNIAQVSESAKLSISRSKHINIKNIDSKGWKILKMVLEHGNLDDTLKSIVVPLRYMTLADEESLWVIFNWACVWTIEYEEGAQTVLFQNGNSWTRLLWLVNDERNRMANA